jgi:hypothetical protein
MMPKGNNGLPVFSGLAGGDGAGLALVPLAELRQDAPQHADAR